MANRVEISKRLIFINSLAGIALDVANLGVLVWLYRHLLHRISQEEFALYPVVASATVFLPLLTVVLSSGLGRYALVAYAQGDERRVTQIVSTMFPLHLALGVLVLAAGGLFAWYIDRVLTIPPARVGDARLMMFLTVLSFSVASALGPFQVGFHIRQKIALLNATILAREIVRIAILFVLVLGVSPRVLWIVVSTVAAMAPWLVATTLISRRLVPSLTFRRREFHWPLARQLTSFGGWMLIGHFAWLLRQAMDPLILNKLAAPPDVTCFYLGSLPLRRIEAALSPVNQAVLPQTTAIHALQDTRRLQNAYLRLSRYCLWASLLAATPLIVFHREVVRLWVGEQFLSAGTVMALLLSTFVIYFGHGAMANIGEAKAQVKSMNLRGLGLQLLNLALSLYLVGVLHLGALGAALGTFLTTFLAYPLIDWPLGLRLGEISLGRWLRETYLPGVIPACTGALACLGAKMYVQPDTLGTVGSCAAFGMAVYVAVLGIWCLQPADRADLARVIRRIDWLGRQSRDLLTRWVPQHR
jgi:O-antigen/teichoic acid export membrane protein